MKRNTWQEYQKEVADDNYYYLRSCIRQNFFPGSEKAFVRILREELGRNLYDDPAHTSCTGIGYHSDVVLHDLIGVFHPDAGIPDEELYYYKRIE